jgi:hypothetical protein
MADRGRASLTPDLGVATGGRAAPQSYTGVG